MIAGVSSVPTDKNLNQVNGANGKLGKDEFMKLLVAQLQAQDPTNPMDAQDFSAQLAQFSAVEQMFNVNTNLENLQETQTALSNNSVVNLIGKTIDAPGRSITLKEGVSQKLSYSLPNNADSVVLDIFNSTGNPVITVPQGSQQKGINSIMWNGLDAEGKKAPDGEYTFQIRAFDGSGKEMDVEEFSAGKVTEVAFENGISYAIVNGEKIPAGEITRVGLN
jgi:flagellar basal-body rod modification protein FlgD